ncbi:DUF4651 domain-containing protein [Streptococcus anginosus]|uniref:DUF4651 domain-containing protein n=1 Tax=Streptococcus anginosus TaxID=1328 RepID=A0A448AKF4_STRAP|nr:DUF4651 domain-containing protein [Streptococcus anginosus]GAD40000.1 hypothetical protein ANG3_0463 [Streptococcus intermedius SK54 = ATCC 27335]EGL47773.1 hypothetical protein HMPREF9966_1716 [Streptococcus anginosus SK52 = DSM 20563]MBZ2157699.1 DUF4651 domain-containing protein [Streptococcus anginosus]ORE82497.1 hypothetical protein B6C93_06335 [Streptococcus anginosus SK52 = DSM 20563]UEB01923.1 DUF4651 domain-containing protein [Streptococcus anginosus subsp. anginosus]
MKAKKILLTTAALAGVGIAAYATKKTLDERKEAEQREQLVADIRKRLSELGPIATLYVQLYKSDEHRLVGGVVYEDNRHLTFVYENGELTYEEEQ